MMDFYQRVGIVCRSVPRGKVATYGQIALLCQKPRNSRQVGYALNHNLSGSDLPAHRIVNHRGFLSGSGSFSGPDTQKLLLEYEGVKVDPYNYVDLKLYGWRHSAEDARSFIKIFNENGI